MIPFRRCAGSGTNGSLLATSHDDPDLEQPRRVEHKRCPYCDTVWRITEQTVIERWVIHDAPSVVRRTTRFLLPDHIASPFFRGMRTYLTELEGRDG